MWYYNNTRSGRIGAGTYTDLPCFGESFITGDLHCERLSTIGSFRSIGSVNADTGNPVRVECRRFYVSGLYQVPVTAASNALFYSSSDFYGTLFASGELIIHKNFHGAGRLQAKRITVNGPADFQGPLSGFSLKVNGALSIGNDAKNTITADLGLSFDGTNSDRLITRFLDRDNGLINVNKRVACRTSDAKH